MNQKVLILDHELVEFVMEWQGGGTVRARVPFLLRIPPARYSLDIDSIREGLAPYVTAIWKLGGGEEEKEGAWSFRWGRDMCGACC